MAPQVVGVLLKKPGQQNHPRITPLDRQETKIRGEFPFLISFSSQSYLHFLQPFQLCFLFGRRDVEVGISWISTRFYMPDIRSMKRSGYSSPDRSERAYMCRRIYVYTYIRIYVYLLMFERERERKGDRGRI